MSLYPVIEVQAQEGDLLLLKDVPFGSIVYDPTWEGLSSWETRQRVIDWIVVAKNHPGYPSNSVTLFSKEVIWKHRFHYDEMNRWENSSLRQSANGSVYNAFGSQFKQAILMTNLINKDKDNNEYYTSDKVFIPSVTEVVAGEPTSNRIGTRWEGMSRDYLVGYSYNQSRNRFYWTRTPRYGVDGDVMYINAGRLAEDYEYTYASRSSDAYTFRAALNMRDGVVVKEDGNGKYEIVYNPVTPGISVGSYTSTSIPIIIDRKENPIGLEYRIERSLNGTSNWQVVRDWDTSLSYNDTSLVPNTKYYYRVKARAGGVFESGYSNVVSAVTLANTPGLTIGNTTTHSIPLTIDTKGNSSSTQYQIERSNNGTSGWQIVRSWSTSTTFNNASLPPGTIYYYRVKARNMDNKETSYSSVVSRATLPSSVSNLKVNTEVTQWSQNEGRIKVILTWDKPVGATGFFVDVHDGYTWRAFDVGNTTSWNSSEAKIYPEESKISEMPTNTRTENIFHTNKGGLDLRDDPRNLYRSALLDDYNNIQYYMFRVRPYGVNGKDYPGPSAAINSPVTSAKEGSPIINSVSTVDGNTRLTDTTVDLRVSATASGSGLKGIYVSDQPNMAGAVFYQWPTQGQNSGTMTVKHDIGYKSGGIALYVKAANMNNVQSDEAYILNLYAVNDITPPMVKPILNSGDEFATSSYITMTLDAHDDLSNVNDLKIRYSFDGISWIPGSGMWDEFVFIKGINVPYEPTNEVQIVRVFVQAKDKAGNIGNGYASIKYVMESKLQEEMLKTRQLYDTEKPRIIGLKLKNGGSISKTNNVQFSFAVEDNVTLPENIRIQVSTNGISWSDVGLYDGGASYYFSGSGYKELYIKTIDEAGNYTIETISFFIQ